MSGQIVTSKLEWHGTREAASAPSSKGSPAPSARQSETAESERARGVLAVRLGYQNVAAGLSAAQLYTAWAGAGATLVQAGEIVLFRGAVLGMSLRANARKTAGTATLEAYADGVATGAVMTWNDHEYRAVRTFAPNRYQFAAGAELDVRITTSSSFAPTTVDLGVILFVSQTAREAQPA